MNTFGDLPDDTKSSLLRGLADDVARDREHSMVDGSVRRKISSIVSETIEAGGGQGDEATIVQRVSRELSPVELEGIVSDWMRLQVL